LKSDTAEDEKPVKKPMVILIKELATEKASAIPLPTIEPEFVELAKEYIDKSKSRDKWEIFLHGLSATHETNSSLEREVHDQLKKTYPTPEIARQKCKSPSQRNRAKQQLFDTYSKTVVSQSVCDVANNWDEISKLFETCKLDEIPEKVHGLRYKGADMTGLLFGCDTIVVDRHMIRYFLSEDQCDDKCLDLIRHTQFLYNLFKEMHTEIAKKLGMQIKIYHTALWLKRVKQTPDKAKEFIDELYG